MELITTAMELTKEVAEVTKEAAEATKELSQTGKASGEISFGKHGDIPDCTPGCLRPKKGGMVSFGSLANGELQNNENYLKWKDGVNVGEVNESWIKELSNEIVSIYGKDNLTVTDMTGFDNMGIFSETGEILYDKEFLADIGNKFGEDSILSAISHEVGHRLVHNLGLSEGVTEYESEACADYISGLTTRLCKLNSTDMIKCYASLPEVTRDGIHPGKSVRTEAFVRGLSRIDRGAEAKILKTFENFNIYDLEGTYQNSDLLKSILFEDVIEPLRNGEIKKV